MFQNLKVRCPGRVGYMYQNKIFSSENFTISYRDVNEAV